MQVLHAIIKAETALTAAGPGDAPGRGHVREARTTMKRTMTPGPMASAASVEGANAPTARPSEVDAKDSSVRMPQNLANLRKKQWPPVPASAGKRAEWAQAPLLSWQRDHPGLHGKTICGHMGWLAFGLVSFHILPSDNAPVSGGDPQP